ncbi:hypothetical protein DL96DRAFT_1576667 [Flagelloscypha sp. PMI_526]|nr:hypothetical protein DL96DRAFT_1576667 [Flagelloscypha sp. PMI_526]
MASFRSGRGSRKPYSRPAPRDTDSPWVHDKAPGAAAAVANGSFNNGSIVNAPSNTKLVVSNLHYEISGKDLADIFGKIGTLVREPHIRYDASGRSTGVAIITFESPEEATEAKRQYDGKLAKGQNIKVAYDTFISGGAGKQRSVSTGSLLNRIQKPPLKDRLSQDDIAVKPTKRGQPGGNVGGIGPIRNRGGIRGGRGGARPAPRKPRTAEDLDKELDAFMGDSSSTAKADAPVPAAPTVVSGTDVDMA